MYYIYYAKQDSFEWTPFHYKEELKTLVDRGLFLIRRRSTFYACFVYWLCVSLLLFLLSLDFLYVCIGCFYSEVGFRISKNINGTINDSGVCLSVCLSKPISSVYF